MQYTVSLLDGSSETIEAERREIDHDLGLLVFYDGTSEVRRFGKQEWCFVIPAGLNSNKWLYGGKKDINKTKR